MADEEVLKFIRSHKPPLSSDTSMQLSGADLSDDRLWKSGLHDRNLGGSQVQGYNFFG